MGIGISQHRNSDGIQDFDSLHVYAFSGSGVDVEGNEIQIVVSLQRVSIKFHITLYLEVLPGIYKRPGRGRQTHAANIKVRQTRATLIKNVIDPWQLAFACSEITFMDEAIDNIERQTIELQGNYAFCLAKTQ